MQEVTKKTKRAKRTFRFRTAVGVVISSLLAISINATAIESDAKGLEIATQMDQRTKGYQDFKVDLEMALIDRAGKRSERAMKVTNMEASAGVKSLIKFEAPRDLKGTALLVHGQETKSDDQWIYMPDLKRVKKIASTNKTGSFVGSEFAFEDLGTPDLGKFTYQFLGETSLEVPGLGVANAFKITRFPTDAESGYSKQVVWVDQNEYRTLKVEFYDKKEKLQKTLDMSEFALYQEKFWYPGRMMMTNHQTGRSTELLWKDYQFNNGLKESSFSKRKLLTMR